MATYKVIQDIEAEDKLLGPLTLKQFIYAGVTAICLYASFLAVTKHVIFLLAIFVPPAMFTAFLAFPWTRDQPTEVWALAKVRFLFKPHLRIWNQSGVRELVTITAPKHIEHVYTDGLSQAEVSSRLKALADTIDSRGWAVKNVNVNLYSQPAAITNEPSSDRLIDIANLPQDVPAVDVTSNDDIFQGAVADHFGQMISATNQAHRQQIADQLHQAAVASTQPAAAGAPNDYWFLNQPTQQTSQPRDRDYVTFNTQVVAPGSSDDDLPLAPATPSAADEALAEHIRIENQHQSLETSHLKTIQPLSAQTARRPAAPTPAPAVTQPTDPAILGLANDNDKNVATIARMAGEADRQQKLESPEDEVVISLR